MNKKSYKRIIAFMLCAVFILSTFTACGSKNESTYYTDVQQLADKNISVWSGSNAEKALRKELPDAHIVPLLTISDMLISLADRKIDAFAQAKFRRALLQKSLSNVDYLKGFSEPTEYGVAFSDTESGRTYLRQFNIFLDRIKQDGRFEKLQKEWIEELEPHGLGYEINSWETGDETVSFVISLTSEPFAYMYDGAASGYDLALICEFCKDMKYKLEIDTPNFDGVLLGIGSGKYDIGASGIEITEDRKASMNISNPVFSDESVIYVLTNPDESSYTSISQLDGLRAGVETGSIGDQIVADRFKNSEVFQFKNYSDCALALQNGKIDFFVMDKDYALMLIRDMDSLTVIDESLFDQEYGLAFNKESSFGAQIRKDFNEFVSSNGTKLNEMREDWINNVDTRSSVDIEIDQNAPLIRVATSASGAPFCFFTANGYDGFEIEMLRTFCHDYGYSYSLEVMDFGGLIPSLVSGKSDLLMSSICITEERAKSVDFSIPYATCQSIAVVAKQAEERGFVEKIKDSIYNNLLLESRWKLVVKGIITTLSITLASAIIGSFAGFVIYMISRKSKTLIIKVFDFCSWLIGGLPMVVILMILYYIVFAKSSIPSVGVAIVGFSLSLAFIVYSLLATAVKSIGRGQTEGALSIGLTDSQTFFKIILPQAMVQFIPNYKSALITLIQGTAIVGYIAVEDLTKVSDIIRARTYEAFFPLIITAIIYLILGTVLTNIVKRIEINTDPKNRSKEKILKRFK